jgi:hypothetical protein
MLYRYPSHTGTKTGEKTAESDESGRLLIRIKDGGQVGDGWYDASECERV